ncbi:MAG: DUF4912 domain-containing protein [Polyangiaceae bacterium]|jgi:hypothetical protein
MSDETRVEESKFALAVTPSALTSGELPWGYGENRITAIVRDPDSAYLYWEITDDGIADARRRLGPRGDEGWCNLRVYDTTGRDFDGTNANDYFDIRVERSDREYFLMIRRPTSTMHAEIGVKTHEGFFQSVARSGRADFPRNAPSSNTELEWMTVTSDDAPPAVAPYPSRYAGPDPTLPSRAGAGYVDVWRAAYAPSMPQEHRAHENASSSGAGVHRTYDRSAHIERWWHLDEWRSEWRGGLRFTRRLGSLEEVNVHWREGPFPTDFFSERVAIELLGEPPVHLLSNGVEFTVYGPWRVTIRNFDIEPQRRVLSTWSMRWVRAMTPMIERWGFALERRTTSGFERQQVIAGASEQQMLLERGASEQWRMGASERMWLGASEWMAAGGSETLFAGGSQWGFAGASAFAFVGASERYGASERLGASEWMRAGERRGASEWFGASEWLGGSERLAGSEGLGASERLVASGLGGSSESSGGAAAAHRYATGEKWGGRLEEV